MKSSLSEIKNSVEILTNRLDQVEDRVLGLDDKEDKLEYSDNNNNNNKYEQNIQELYDTVKRPKYEL
jgi:hypothetical protein